MIINTWQEAQQIITYFTVCNKYVIKNDEDQDHFTKVQLISQYHVDGFVDVVTLPSFPPFYVCFRCLC